MRLDKASKAILHAAIRTAVSEMNERESSHPAVSKMQVALEDGFESEDGEGTFLAACVLWLFGARAKKP